MHVVDGDLLKAACNQRPVLHIQHFIEQHHQQIIQKFFLLHASSPPHRFSPAFQYIIFRMLVQRPIRIRIPEDPVLFFAHTASQTCRNHIRNHRNSHNSPYAPARYMPPLPPILRFPQIPAYFPPCLLISSQPNSPQQTHSANIIKQPVSSMITPPVKQRIPESHNSLLL